MSNRTIGDASRLLPHRDTCTSDTFDGPPFLAAAMATPAIGRRPSHLQRAGPATLLALIFLLCAFLSAETASEGLSLPARSDVKTARKAAGVPSYLHMIIVLHHSTVRASTCVLRDASVLKTIPLMPAGTLSCIVCHASVGDPVAVAVVGESTNRGRIRVSSLSIICGCQTADWKSDAVSLWPQAVAAAHGILAEKAAPSPLGRYWPRRGPFTTVPGSRQFGSRTGQRATA